MERKFCNHFLRNCMLMNCRNDTLQDGKIRGKIEEVNNTPNMLENVINALKMRRLKCSEEEGTHFQHFI
jgi:hypothetical protein